MPNLNLPSTPARVVGAYTHNSWFQLDQPNGGRWNEKCCCGYPELWRPRARNLEQHPFAPGSPHWGSADAPLRAQFEAELRGQAMLDAMKNAPFEKNQNADECCCKWPCCPACCTAPKLSEKNAAALLNATWCPRVNEQVLNPAGYNCHMRYWETHHTDSDGSGHTSDHMAMLITKGDGSGLLPADYVGELFRKQRTIIHSKGTGGPTASGAPASAGMQRADVVPT